MGPGGQLSEAALHDYHFYGHTASGRLRHREPHVDAMYRRGEGVKVVVCLPSALSPHVPVWARIVSL